MGVGPDARQPSRLRPPGEAGHRRRAGQAEQRLAGGYRAEHPEAGGTTGVSTMIGYAVIVEQADDGGFGAWSPDLPGCVALGDSVEECLAEMRDAVSLYIEVLRERGEDVPAPRAVEVTTLDPAA